MIVVLGMLMFGLYPALKLLQFQAAEQMETKLRDNMAIEQLMVFKDLHNNKNICWEKVDKEFHLNGEMYDVVRIENGSGTKTYYCINDKKEAQICALANRLVNTSQGDNDPLHTTTHRLLKMFIQVFTPCERYACVMGYTPAHDCAVYHFYSCHYPDYNTKVIIPPPKFSLI